MKNQHRDKNIQQSINQHWKHHWHLNTWWFSCHSAGLWPLSLPPFPHTHRGMNHLSQSMLVVVVEQAQHKTLKVFPVRFFSRLLCLDIQNDSTLVVLQFVLPWKCSQLLQLRNTFTVDPEEGATDKMLCFVFCWAAAGGASEGHWKVRSTVQVGQWQYANQTPWLMFGFRVQWHCLTGRDKGHTPTDTHCNSLAVLGTQCKATAWLGTEMIPACISTVGSMS